MHLDGVARWRGILIVGNVVRSGYGGRAIDLTRDGLVQPLVEDRQPAEVARPGRSRLDVFFGNSPQSSRQLDRVRQLLDLYKAANPSRIRVEYLDPNNDVKEYEGCWSPAVGAEAVGYSADGIVVGFGEGDTGSHTVIGALELFEAQGSRFEARPDRFVSTFDGEDVVTSALIRLREGKRTKIGFTTGHGEPSIGELDPSQPGIGRWRARLASVGTVAVEVNLVRDEIPADVNLLVICGPKSPLLADEVERIRQFFIRGGQLIVLAGGAEAAGLADLLRGYNVEFGTGMAVDPQYSIRGRPFLVLAPIPPGSNHPIVESLAGRVVLLPQPRRCLDRRWASRLKAGRVPRRGRRGILAIVALPFLRTGPESWAESDLNDRKISRDPAKDPAGPLNVGVAVAVRPQTASEKPTPRMVVFSSSHAADNQFVRIEPANLDILMNAIHWLRGRPELLGIDPKTHESLLFAADPGLRLRLVLVPTLLAIVVIIGLGATTYLARRD